MRHAAGLGYEHWFWSDQHAVATSNMLPTRANRLGTPPNVAFHGKAIDNVETYGRAVYAKQTKKTPKSILPGRKGIYIGWSEANRAHRIMRHYFL